MIRLLALVLLAATARAEPPKPKFELGKDTTFITEPLDADGYLDYETALNERLRGKTTPETNAAVLLWQAIGPKPEGREMAADYWKWLGVKPPPTHGEYFGRLDAFIRRKTGMFPDQRQWDAEAAAVKKPWRREDYPLIAEWLDDNERPLDLVRTGMKRAGFFNPFAARRTDGGRAELAVAHLSTMSPVRQVVQALCLRAMLRTGERRRDDAWQDLLAAHRLARHLGRSGAIELFIGLAGDSLTTRADLGFLEHAGLDADRLRACQKDLRALPPFGPLADGLLVSERFVFLDMVQGKRRTAPDAGDWDAALRTGNAVYDRIEKAVRLPNRTARVRELERIEEDGKFPRMELGELLDLIFSAKTPDDIMKLGPDKIAETLYRMHLPAFQKVQDSADRIEQVNRNLHLAFALAAYRVEHGNYPPQLADLAPKFLAAVPDDLFAGKPLVYQPRKNGYLLYSVGLNGKDDGGKTYGDTPSGDDLTVRMPAKR